MDTFGTIIRDVTTRFPRISNRCVENLNDNLFDGITRDLCARFPWWFLEVPPGYLFPENYPRSEAELQAYTKVFGDWLDRGWLHVQAGKSVYLLAAPADFGPDFEDDADFWGYVQAKNVAFVKEFSYNGQNVDDLEVVKGTRHFTQASYPETGDPCVVFWETGNVNGERVSWLRFSPVPIKDRIYAVKFSLKVPIDYDPGVNGDVSVPSGDYTNRLIAEYPEVVKTLGLLEAARWVNEPDSIAAYTKDLYGVPDDGRRTRIQRQSSGMLAQMREDTEDYYEQEVVSIPQYLGAREAVNRGGARSRPRRGVYEQSAGY